jgi:hypothetical protein
VVIINYENPLKKGFDKMLFLQGDIDGHFSKILEELAE